MYGYVNLYRIIVRVSFIPSICFLSSFFCFYSRIFNGIFFRSLALVMFSMSYWIDVLFILSIFHNKNKNNNKVYNKTTEARYTMEPCLWGLFNRGKCRRFFQTNSIRRFLPSLSSSLLMQPSELHWCTASDYGRGGWSNEQEGESELNCVWEIALLVTPDNS